MNCQEVMELMQRFLDRDLSQTEEEIMLAHVQKCPECAEFYERLQLLDQELALLPKVEPPYSIVDSILPRLNEQFPLAASMESGSEVIAAVDSLPVSDEMTERRDRRRARKGWFSWPIASGVAAAGILIGALIFQQGPSEKFQNADALLSTAAKQESAAAVNEARVLDDNLLKGDAVVMYNELMQEDAARKGVGTEDEKPTEDVPFTSNAGGKVSVAGREQPHNVVDQFGSNADSNAVSGSSGNEKPQPKATADVAEEVHEIQGIAGPIVTSSDGGQAETAPEAKALADGTSMPSFSGDYTAVLENGTVVIKGRVADAAAVFTSSVRAAAGETVALDGWLTDSTFRFLHTDASGQVSIWTIDVAAGKETIVSP